MMNASTPERNRRLIAVDGAMALIIVLLVVQVWLLSATLDAFLAGHRDVALPGAVVSGILFLICFTLYQFVVRLERHARKREEQK
jgi:hypothetical protein